MASRLRHPILERIIAALFGILSLALLDFPFWGASLGSYGWINLSSGLQLALEGANPDLANLVWVTFPSAYSSGVYLPTYGSLSIPVVVFTWWVILGALLVEVLGLVAVLFTQGERSKKFGRLIALGGKFVFLGGLLTACQILYQLTVFTARYSTTYYIFVLYPTVALFIEPLLGIVMWALGSRIRHAAPPLPTTRTRTAASRTAT